jgi:hypothetical protein
MISWLVVLLVIGVIAYLDARRERKITELSKMVEGIKHNLLRNNLDLETWKLLNYRGSDTYKSIRRMIASEIACRTRKDAHAEDAFYSFDKQFIEAAAKELHNDNENLRKQLEARKTLENRVREFMAQHDLSEEWLLTKAGARMVQRPHIGKTLNFVSVKERGYFVSASTDYLSSGPASSLAELHDSSLHAILAEKDEIAAFKKQEDGKNSI